jgi:hypothetical protein
VELLYMIVVVSGVQGSVGQIRNPRRRQEEEKVSERKEEKTQAKGYLWVKSESCGDLGRGGGGAIVSLAVVAMRLQRGESESEI